jgi:hypothetical protein
MTVAPSRAKRRAMTWPILSLPAAPSTTAVLPASLVIVSAAFVFLLEEKK